MISLIHKSIINVVIAPHGITDLIHSTNFNTTKQLLTFNSASLIGSTLLSHNNPILLDDLFLLSSIVHFRHDMPNFVYIPNYIFSSLLLKSAIVINHNILFFYMLTLHVPNHYKTNWIHIKKNPYKNIVFIILFTLFLSYLGLNYPFIYESKFIFDLSKGIVISHVIYNELYIHNI